MRNEDIESDLGLRIVLMDSISLIGEHDRGSVVVCGSHGGRISGAFAAMHPPAFVLFSDAGVGKNGAGTASLADLHTASTAAAAVAHVSARIGDARDAWTTGVVSQVNALAIECGVTPGQTVQEAVRSFCGRKRSARIRRGE